MKKVINLAKEYGVSAIALMLPVITFAQSALPAPRPGAGVTVPQGNITSLGSVLDTLCGVFGWAFYFLMALAVIFILVAAFKYLTAGGDPEKVKGAGATLLYAAVAIGVALLAKAIPLVIGNFLSTNGPVQSC